MVSSLGKNLTTRPSTPPPDAGKTPAQGEGAPASPSRQRHLGGPGSGALAGLKSRASDSGARLKTAAAAGGLRLRAGTHELAKLTGAKVKEKVAEQLTPENIAKVAATLGKVAIKSAPALAGGPAAFGAAVMANGGKEIAADVAGKVKEELSNPETQKKILVGGAKLAKQAFSKPAQSTPDA